MTPASPPDPRKTRQRRQTSQKNGPSPNNEGGAPSGHRESGESRQAPTVWEAQRSALAEAFPAWKIVCVAHLSIPLWFALYSEPLTLEQERAGFRPTILRGSAEDLQAELALRCRVTRLPLPPSIP
ncbi:hypothetical protein GCM10017673_18340 [Streptosporangium violaceochromogenes]|nr:hypothetical protein GCM10017673_18340 [Streptosporangium violaceochromogenes]